jgi:chemotaxis regulatin CheY-phosphate phosphatase CheZ
MNKQLKYFIKFTQSNANCKLLLQEAERKQTADKIDKLKENWEKYEKGELRSDAFKDIVRNVITILTF